MAQADQAEGNGTGIVWDKEGHIVTNFHVLGASLQQQGTKRPDGSQKIAQVTLLGTNFCPTAALSNDCSPACGFTAR